MTLLMFFTISSLTHYCGRFCGHVLCGPPQIWVVLLGFAVVLIVVSVSRSADVTEISLLGESVTTICAALIKILADQCNTLLVVAKLSSPRELHTTQSSWTSTKKLRTVVEIGLNPRLKFFKGERSPPIRPVHVLGQFADIVGRHSKQNGAMHWCTENGEWTMRQICR